MTTPVGWTITFTPKDFDQFEFAVADYVAKWGEHLTGRPYQDPEFGTNLAGIPTAVGNMAGTVLRKWVTKRDANDLGGKSGKPTDAGTENGGAPVVEASTDCAPRPAVSDLLARLRIWEELLADLGEVRRQVLDVAVEVEKLTAERDRLQELVAESQAAYDELAARVDADAGRRGD